MLKLDEIINSVMSQYELPDSSFGRLSTIAIRGYRQMHYHSIGEPRTVTVDISGNQTAKMPCEALTILSVGVVNGKGQLAQLTEDTTLVNGDSPSRTSPPRPTEDTIFSNEDYLFTDPINSLTYPGFFQQQYGRGSQSDLGFYKLDYKAREIVFDFGNQHQSVEVEILPMCEDDGIYYVHPLFQEALCGWTEWQHMRGMRRKYNANDIEEAKQYYDNQLRIARRAQNPFDPAQVYNAYYQTTRLARF